MSGDKTWIDGNVPTAADYNGYFRDQVRTICTSGTHPASPVNGRKIFETDTGRSFTYDTPTTAWVQDGGISAWSSYTPTMGSTGTAPAPLAGGTPGTCAGRYFLRGKSLELRIEITFFTTSTYGTGSWTVSLPAGMTACATQSQEIAGMVYDASATTAYSVGFELAGSGSSGYMRLLTGASGLVGTTVPFTFATLDTIRLWGTVEIA